MRASPVALLLLLVPLGGCLSGAPGAGDSAFDPLWSEHALPDGDGHDHADPAHHTGRTTDNFDVLGFTRFTSEHYGGPTGGYLCGDAQQTADGRRLAVVESRSDVGFAVLETTDPTAPVLLGELVMERTYIYDVAMVLDGRHVVLATAGTDNIPPAGLPLSPTQSGGLAPAPQTASPAAPVLLWKSACTGGPVPVKDERGDQHDDILASLPYPMNLLLVDIGDPTAPAIVDIQPLAGYGHSVFPYRQDGRDLLVVAAGGLPTVGQQAAEYSFWAVEEGPASARLALQHRYDPGEGDPGHLDTYRRHDAWVAPHPGTGVMTAYLAGGPWLTTMDVTDATAPERLGRWDWPVADGILHGAFPLPGLWDGRHYTVVGPEYCSHPEATPSGVAWVLDTTDPAAPEAVAAWTLPHEVQWDGCYMFSNHYFTVAGTTLFMSMYHGGVWAIDLGPLQQQPQEFLRLDSIGVFLPADPRLEAPAEPVRWAPTIEEVLAMPDGTLVTFDGNYGLYTLAFDAGRPAPAPQPWAVDDPR